MLGPTMAEARVEAFDRFRNALRQHFIPEATLIKAFNVAWNAAGGRAPEPEAKEADHG